MKSDFVSVTDENDITHLVAIRHIVRVEVDGPLTRLSELDQITIMISDGLAIITTFNRICPRFRAVFER